MPLLAARRPSAVLRLLVVFVVAATLAAGVWVAGGLITDDFRLSIALTTAWFAIAGAGCLIVAVRVPALRLPVLATYVVVAGAIGSYLGLTTLRDRVVDETVVTSVPRQSEPAPEAGAAPRPQNAELLRGRFRSGEHATTGMAAIVRLADGRRFLTLTSFSTSPGPDLRVRLVRGDSQDGGAAGAVDLGALKGNRGDQQYRIPRGVVVAGRSVVIWCRAFSAPFGSARLA
jgi:Electron transfer DM13